MKAKAFIIHLERATARRPQVAWLQENLPLPAEVLPAVDGSRLRREEIERLFRRALHRPRYPFALSKAEIGCFESHRQAWRQIVDRDLDYGLIVEDDISFKPEIFTRAFGLASQSVKDGGYIRFPWRDRETAREVIAQDGGCRLYRPRRIGLGMLAQLVSKTAARQLLMVSAPFDRPVDTLLQMHWVTGINPLSVFPNSLNEISVQLGGSTISSKSPAVNKLRRELMRPLYRGKIAFQSRVRR